MNKIYKVPIINNVKDLENFIHEYIKRSTKLNTLAVYDSVDSDATLEGRC